MFDLDHIVFRPATRPMVNQNVGDRYRNVIGIFMNRILQGMPMPIFGDGAQSRAFTYISDVAPVIASAIDMPAAFNQIYNIGADEHYTVKALGEMTARAMGVEPVFEFLPPRNEVKHTYSSHDKLKLAFGVRPSVSLEEGLEKMACWVKSHGVRSSKKFDRIEIMRKLPPSWLSE